MKSFRSGTITKYGTWVFLFLAGCSAVESTEADTEVIELSEFRTFVSYEENLIATPNFIRFDDQSNLFVYDAGKRSVLKLNRNGEIEHHFGRKGRGPGEFQWVNHIHLTRNYLYIVDTGQFLIHKYTHDGVLDSSFNYGELGYTPSLPSPPVSTSVIMVSELINQPHITADGDVMLSPVQMTEPAEQIYHLYDWNGKIVSEYADIPEGATFVLDNEEIRDDILAGVIPGFYRANVFPILDPSNSDQLILVYSSLPKIARYSLRGEKIWEAEVPDVHEINTITENFFETMERMQRADIRSRVNLTYYHSGVIGPNGDLYLVTNMDSVWIHRFSPDGILTQRYKLETEEEIDLKPIVDIDFANREIFIVSELGDIRAYSF